MDVHPRTRTVTVGSADHALYSVALSGVAGKLDELRLARTLYTKRSGHSEWVTCCTALPSGRVMSGGMDSRLLIWDAHAPTSRTLDGHEGSITSIKASSSEQLAVSSSYDGTLRAWDLSSGREVGQWGGDQDGAIASGDYMAATRNPILDFVWDGGSGSSDDANGGDRLVACTKDGRLLVHDLNRPTREAPTTIRAHRGPTRTVLVSQTHPSVLVSAGNLDGAVRMFDLRVPATRGRCVKKHENLHAGGVTNLVAVGARGFVSAGGGDGTVKLLDPASLEVVQTWEVGVGYVGAPGAAVYAVCPVQEGVITAWGDGRVCALEFDREGITARFEVTSLKNTLRALQVVETDTGPSLVGVGDDGFVFAWDCA
ncbi:hypothetical protein HKX48_000357 [Thoreauomyces humboldtii]|nr:hypothetical protein HKX48_000357 [Thoreauomyces humboldtii]